MCSDVAIRAQNISKCYQIYNNPRDRLKQFILPPLQNILKHSPKQYFDEFWALKDVSLEVNKGETVGIIGRNGSGKSTLLQIICGMLSPNGGVVETNGRVAALLELGSGFNPEFTGRENVYMNAALLGLRKKEIDARLEDIVAFADIGDFVERPVKTYSSGMVLRLAFAVQSQIDPDILAVDEALSVGDAKFQVKCFNRLKQLQENGTAILLVTHSIEQIVTHCSHAILLNDGAVLEAGEARRVANCYQDLLFGKEKKTLESAIPQSTNSPALPVVKSAYELSNQEDIFSTQAGYNHHEYRWGDGSATILDFYLAAEGEAYPAAVTTGQKMCLAISVRFNDELIRPILGISIKTKEGVTVYGVNTETLDCDEFQALGAKESIVHVEAYFGCRLAPGDYFISLGVATRQGEEIIPHDRRFDSIHISVRPDTNFFGLADLGLELSAKKIDP